MSIPFLDLLREFREVEAETNAALARVLSSGLYILGPEVSAFESEWAEFCGVQAAAGVASGTDALSLALIASGAVRPGQKDEVITSPLTAGYTALAIVKAGAVPVFADIDSQTFTLDPEAIEGSITERTRAIVPVHLYGLMADMPAIIEVAARHDLCVIEDAAQAHGAVLAGKRAGSHGHAAAFSFYPTKNLGAFGDSGAVVSNDAELIKRVRRLREGGHQAALGENIAGFNSRLDEIQAAFLRVKLTHLDAWNDRRRNLARTYDRAFDGASLTTLKAREPEAHVYHRYVVQSAARDELRSFLDSRGIGTMIDYPFLGHQQPLFLQQRTHPPLAVAEGIAGTIVTLPLYAHLRDDEQRSVIDAVGDWDGGKRKAEGSRQKAESSRQ